MGNRVFTLRCKATSNVHYPNHSGSWKLVSFRCMQDARKFINESHHSRMASMPFDCWVSSTRCGCQGMARQTPARCIIRGLHPFQRCKQSRISNLCHSCLKHWRSLVLVSKKLVCHAVESLASVGNLVYLWHLTLCGCIQEPLQVDLKQSIKGESCHLIDFRRWSLQKMVRWVWRMCTCKGPKVQTDEIPKEFLVHMFEAIHLVKSIISFLVQNSHHNFPFCGHFWVCELMSDTPVGSYFEFAIGNSDLISNVAKRDQVFGKSSINPYPYLLGSISLRSCLWLFLVYTMRCRIGEAINPGPWVSLLGNNNEVVPADLIQEVSDLELKGKLKKSECFIPRVPCIFLSIVIPMIFTWFLGIYTLDPRIGEAKNPGPFWNDSFPNAMRTESSDFLWVGACNPTQLFGKEEICASWGQGIWTYAETSATPKAACAIRTRFRNFGSSIVFGELVKPLQPSSLFRGRAGGVAISSSFPIRQHIHPQPEWLSKSTRFVDAVVHVHGHVPIYVSSIYGVAGKSSSHPMELTEDIMNQAADRVAKYRGPAIICGDFNSDISCMQASKNLQLQGWHDVALLDSAIHGRPAQATSKFGNRHSFILANNEMCRTFVSCRTSENFDFDSHPLLVGCFRISSLMRPTRQWILPKSLDQFLFDSDSIVTKAQSICRDREYSFGAMLKTGDMDGAARQLTIAIEDTLQNSAVDVEGNPTHIPPGHFGRSRQSPLCTRHNYVPSVKPGRQGEFNPLMSQTTKGIRSHVKQFRRIQALKQQMASFLTSNNVQTKIECDKLWKIIVAAHGFRGGFAKWISDHVDPLIPLCTPSLEFVNKLFECFQKYFQNEQCEHFLKQSVVRKHNLIVDIENGGKDCFRAVRDEPVPPLSSITWTEKFAVPKIRWTKSGRKDLPFLTGQDVNPLFPILFQGQTRNIVKVTHKVVHLDEPVKLKNCQDNFFTQNITSAEVGDIHNGLIQEWSKLWNRDPVVDDQQNWQPAAEFLTSLQDCPSCPFREINEEVWLDSLRGVKKLTARGADGFSTKDCYLIKGELLTWLIRILKSIENGNPWPKQWVLARVVVLSKGSEPKTPLDVRPISVLSKFYRLWSRLRSLEVLHHIGGLMPPQVSATSGGVSADLLAAYTADQIESSHYHNKWMCGLVIDLVKCYNLVPWLPSQWIFKKLGIPTQYVTAMFDFLKSMKRTFDFHGDCSALVTATNGIAEGCAMSVSLMAALSWFCHKVMDINHADAIAICYADNWGVNTFSHEELRRASYTLESICSALKMVISIPKSWFWTTNKSWKPHLKAIIIQGQHLQIKDSAIDLGCDQNYGKRLVLKSQKARLAKAKRVMQRIHKKKLPRHFRATMVQSCGFGTFAYGQSIQYVPASTWKSLRSSTVSGIRRNGGCASPLLACLFHKFPIDPQYRGIVRALCFWRKYFTIFPRTSSDFCERLVWEGQFRGPATNLRRTLADIGWTCLNNGYIQHHTGFEFNWTTCSQSFLKKTLKQFWSSFVAEKTCHRKDFDIASVDDLNISRCIRKFEPSQRSLLISYMIGTACTNDFKAKFGPEVSNLCCFCGKEDSRCHRIFECEHLCKTRKGKGNFLAWLRNQPEATKNLMLYEQNWSFLTVLQQYQLPWPEARVPELEDVDRHIFCDGSAFWQEQPSCAISGMGVIESFWLENKHKVLYARPLPGLDHNSYRAECFAILMTLVLVYRPVIYSDCLSAVDFVLYLLQCHCRHHRPTFTDHQDIWLQVWRQIQARPPEAIRVIKTKAHEDPGKIDQPSLKWQAVMNNKVDLVAKAAVSNWFPVFSKAEAVFQKITKQVERFEQHCHLIVDQAQCDPPKGKICDPSETIPDWSSRMPCPSMCENFRIDIPQDVTCPFGDIFLQRVVEWAKRLEWPSNGYGQVSMLELYVDFTLFSKSLAPVSLPPENKKYKCCYKLSDLDKLASVTIQNLAQQSIVWNRFIKWTRSNGFLLWEGESITKSYALSQFGYALWAPAVQGHPIFISGVKVYQIIHDFFNTPTGRRRHLNIPYNCPS